MRNDYRFRATGYSWSAYFPLGVKWLLISNTAIFVLCFLFPSRSVFQWFSLSPEMVLKQFAVWQLVTYMFLHGGIGHILFNMLALWMFGAQLERVWGTRYFLKFYFVTGIGAGGIFLVVVIVVCGLIATQASRFNWSGLRDQINIDDEDFNNLFGESFNFDDHIDQDFPVGASLKVLDDHGAVSIHAGNDDSNKITVSVRKRIGADNQSDANKYNAIFEANKPMLTSPDKIYPGQMLRIPPQA